MPLTLTIEDLYDGIRAMQTLAQWRPTNLRLAYNIGRIWKDYKERIEETNELRRQILRDFAAEETASPNGIELRLPEKISVEDRKAYEERIKELNKVQVEVWGNPLSFEELSNAQSADAKGNMPLSGDDLSLLFWLIAEPQETQPEEKPRRKAKSNEA